MPYMCMGMATCAHEPKLGIMGSPRAPAWLLASWWQPPSGAPDLPLTMWLSS